MPGHRDVIPGPAQRGGEVPGHDGGAAAAPAVAAGRRTARAPARYRAHRARFAPAATRQLTPITLQTHHLQR